MMCADFGERNRRWKCLAPILLGVGCCLFLLPWWGRAEGSFLDLQSLAITEMQNIATAEDLAFLDTGYYVSIENLNDLALAPPIHYFDDINYGGGTAVIDVQTGRFKPDRVNLVAPILKWQGPYINYDPSRISLTGSGYDVGTLLDFWGSPYYLFSPVGLVNPASMSITLSLYGDTFDRYAIVSLGPDGVKSSDDLAVLFGVPPTSLVISSVSPLPGEPGGTMTMRGYNFGGSQGDSRVELNGTPLTATVSWSDRQVLFNLPLDAHSGLVSVVVGGIRSNEIYLAVQSDATAARLWTLYF